MVAEVLTGALDTHVFLTRDGRRRLRRRLRALSTDVATLAEAMGAGDGAGDPDEYHAALRDLDDLSHVLRVARDVGEVAVGGACVSPGDEVTVEFADGTRDSFVLVHPVEATLTDDRASIASPLGSALLGRCVGDSVEVHAPNGPYTCTIVDRRLGLT